MLTLKFDLIVNEFSFFHISISNTVLYAFTSIYYFILVLIFFSFLIVENKNEPWTLLTYKPIFPIYEVVPKNWLRWLLSSIEDIIIIIIRLFGKSTGEDIEGWLHVNTHNAIFWWEPWSFEVLAYFPPFNKKFFNSPWHFYYKYRLSSWIRWHILEDRICIFVLFFLFILI